MGSEANDDQTPQLVLVNEEEQYGAQPPVGRLRTTLPLVVSANRLQRWLVQAESDEHLKWLGPKDLLMPRSSHPTQLQPETSTRSTSHLEPS
jgi:hypothetical protein